MFRPGTAPDDGVWQLLATGTHSESYRVLCVLETVSELVRRGCPVKLSLSGQYGWPGAAANIRDWIKERGIEARQVSVGGAFQQVEAPEMYRRAHILLHPKYHDPCPTVPIEAMASGVPVIASRSGGMPELVSTGCGCFDRCAAGLGGGITSPGAVEIMAGCPVLQDHGGLWALPGWGARTGIEQVFEREVGCTAWAGVSCVDGGEGMRGLSKSRSRREREGGGSDLMNEVTVLMPGL